MQAQLEAVAIRLSMIFDQLKSGGQRGDGRGRRLAVLPAWAQMIADAFNAPIQLLAEAEITARGVALLLREPAGRRASGCGPAAHQPRLCAPIPNMRRFTRRRGRDSLTCISVFMAEASRPDSIWA